MRFCRLIALTAVGLCLMPNIGKAQTPAPHIRARAALDADNPESALELLKAAVAETPDDASLRLLLAEAYLKSGNERWALRTLTELRRTHTDACAATLAIAAILLEKGKAEEADTLLAETICPQATPEGARLALLRARTLHALGEKSEAAAKLKDANRARRMYPEDRGTLSGLLKERDETYIVPATGKVETAFGWASDARAGSPRDAAA